MPATPDKTDLLARFRKRLYPATRENFPDTAGQLSTPERFTDFELGANDPENPLPISEYKDVILESIANNRVTIVVAETGAGKSTQVPQYLLEAGYTVDMTQPRRLAANMLCDRIGEEVADAFDDSERRNLVGLHTAEYNTVTDTTRITVLTDGLRLVQELNDREDVENEVLIIDEVHEWNTNIEVLIAWTKKMLKEKPALRVVLMSATMDAHRLADYFSDVVSMPPVIEVPGRMHDVEKFEEPGSTVFEQVIKYAREGKDILTFLPGVREIKDMQSKLEAYFTREGMSDITVLPLHGKLSNQEQQAVDREYPGPKIVLSTNVAQTSLTIKGMDVVVDSGLERRIEIDEEGVQSLRLHAISQADSKQRAGRVGRTHPGIYVLTRLDEETEHVPFINRDEYPMPEILRSDVDRNTLAIAATGLDFSELDLFHPLDHERLLQSRHRMQLLGALDEQGRITSLGKRMNQFPVHPTSSRMLIEAENYSQEIQSYVAAIVSTVEVGMLPSYLHNASKDWKELTAEQQSDHLAQLDIFIAVQEKKTERELGDLGLDVRNVVHARELHDKITRRVGMKPRPLEPPTEQQRAEIIECVVAGLVDFVYEASGRNEFVRAIGDHAVRRVISNRSTVRPVASRIVVGTPYQYWHAKKGEQRVIEKVTSDFAIPRILGKVASRLVSWQKRGAVKWRDGQPVYEEQAMFRDTIPTGDWHEQPAHPSPELRSDIMAYVLENPGNAQKQLRATKKELDRLRRLSKNPVPQLTQNDLHRLIDRATPADITDPTLVDELLRRIVVQERLTIDDFVSSDERARIEADSPASIEIGDLTLSLRYSNGKVRAHINNPADISGLEGEVILSDGRHVQLMYQGKPYVVDQLKVLHHA